MRARAIGIGVVALAAAGCGGSAKPAAAPAPPKLPRTLAQSWAQQADAIAASLAAGDGCTAEIRAVALRTQVVQAVNERRIATRYLESLVSTVNDLPARISCTVAPAPATTKHDHKDKHGKGNGSQQGDQGGGGGD
ncbi:MAG: hypothetical protein JWM06_544 [Actinomycetia bacterium]|nr:hypothetical protein [Actinomycetes bacterium]